MALISMTGFGRGAAAQAGLRVEVEIGTLNRKQLDLRLTLPRTLVALEPRVAALLQARLRRGQVTLSARMTDAAAPGPIIVDRRAAAEAVAALRQAARALDLPDRLDASILLTLPGVLVARDPGQDAERVWPVLQAATTAALDALVRMRSREGAALERELLRRIKALEAPLRAIVRRTPVAARRHQALLRRRLAEAGLAPERRDPQWLREVMQAVERGDVTEELVRLREHLQHARELIAGDPPAGRPLDFLCQELLREINTLGAKSADAVIAQCVVAFKSALETLREQVQNVE